MPFPHLPSTKDEHTTDTFLPSNKALHFYHQCVLQASWSRFQGIHITRRIFASWRYVWNIKEAFSSRAAVALTLELTWGRTSCCANELGMTYPILFRINDLFAGYIRNAQLNSWRIILERILLKKKILIAKIFVCQLYWTILALFFKCQIFLKKSVLYFVYEHNFVLCFIDWVRYSLKNKYFEH